MRHCPQCNGEFPDQDKFCPDCGHVLEDAAGPAAESGAAAGAAAPEAAPAQAWAGAAGAPKPSLWENPIFWIASGAGLLVVIAGAVLLLVLGGSDEPAPVASTGASTTRTASTATTDSGVKKYQDDLTKSWKTLRDITVELVKKDKEVVDQASLNTFNALLTVSSDKIEQVRNEMGRLEPPKDYKDRHQNLIDAVGKYREYTKGLLSVTSQDPAKVNTASFSPVNTLGEDAKTKIEASEKQLPFLQALPDDCFTLHTSLSPFYEAIWSKPQAPAPRAATPAPAPAPAPVGSEQDAILAMVLSDSAGSWAGADNYEVVSYDPTTNSAIVLVTYYLPDTIRYVELYCDKDQYGWYVSYENAYEVPY